MSALLITATVTPHADVPLLRVRDPAIRQREYLAALEHHLTATRKLGSRVVFAENSGSDLSPFVDLADRTGAASRFEALHVPAAPPEFGRSVGEARIVAEAMKRSDLLQSVDGSIWKLTGRYTVRNLAVLIRTAPTVDLYINLRRHPTEWCDTYAYAFTRTGYDRYLADIEERLVAKARDGVIAGEVVMVGLVQALLDSGEPIVPRFRHEPRVDGIRGYDLRSYSGVKQRTKYWARVVARRVAPSVWL